VVGLTYFLGFQSRGLLGPVEIYALPEVLQGVQQHLFSETLFPVLPEFLFRAVAGGEVVPLPGGGEVTVLPVHHRGPTVGYFLRLSRATVAYLTDTRVEGSRQHLGLLEGVDLLMHEWYFPDGYEHFAEETGHSCLSQVLQLGKEAKAKQLLLMHLNPVMDSASAWGFDGKAVAEPPAIVAEDLLEIEIDGCF
jgi:ribonuclease BN (tRNA processing enzyme)